MSINESDIFEENNLYILGNTFKNTVESAQSEFRSILNDIINSDDKMEENEEILKDLDTSDIYIKTIEEDVEEIISENREKIISKKKIFNLDKNKSNLSEEKKPNHLRNEAKHLEESIKNLKLPTYSELKIKKFSDCSLFSYHFFKQFCKKEIGKENNYIFNFRDNFLNDMTKIDKDFFEDYFKFNSNVMKTNENKNRIGETNANNNFKSSAESNDNLSHNIHDVKFSNLKNELIYEFAIYHPFKNSKTQQISISGNSHLYELKDKIYCVLDEIHPQSQSSFFFIEGAFYNDNRSDIKNLSSKISENKIRKLNINTISSNNITNIPIDINLQSSGSNKNKSNENAANCSKAKYEKYNYCNVPFYPPEIYEELSMGDLKINEIFFRIGYPYLYRHIDYCDHMIMLIDLRIADVYDKFLNEDNQKSLVTYQKKLKRRICDGCLLYYAKFISINDRVGDENNKILFICEYCLKKLHEKELKENTLAGLKLIPYYHD